MTGRPRTSVLFCTASFCNSSVAIALLQDAAKHSQNIAIFTLQNTVFLAFQAHARPAADPPRPLEHLSQVRCYCDVNRHSGVGSCGVTCTHLDGPTAVALPSHPKKRTLTCSQCTMSFRFVYRRIRPNAQNIRSVLHCCIFTTPV